MPAENSTNSRVLLVGVVYAAANGQLTFSGAVTLKPPITQDLELKIIPEPPEPTTVKGSSGSMTVSPDGQSANITVTLTEPGEKVKLSFNVENTGGLDALISDVITDNPNAEIKILDESDYTDLKGESVKAGEFVFLSAVDIVVGWPVGVDVADYSKPFEFTIKLEYEQE